MWEIYIAYCVSVGKILIFVLFYMNRIEGNQTAIKPFPKFYTFLTLSKTQRKV